MDSVGLRDNVPPQNIEAEEATIGALLLNFSTEALDAVTQHLRAEDFYKTAHQHIFRSIINLNEHGSGIDLLTITEDLRSRETLQKAGGAAGLAALTNTVPTTANIEYYAKMVLDSSIRRKLINAAQKISSDARSESHDYRIVLDQAEKVIFDINSNFNSNNLKDMQSILPETMKIIEERCDAKTTYTGVPVGINDLDDVTFGLQNSELIIVGARPSIGKTALALTFIANIVLAEPAIPCGFFSLEMSADQLMQRVLASEGRIDSRKLRSGLLRKADFPQIVNAAGRLYEAPLYIDDTPNIRLLDLRAQARRMVSKFDVKVIFIDYLGLITSDNTLVPRHEQMADISRSLKALARELDIPVVALSQVGRQSEGKAPGLADLRESGAIEQDADVVMFLHRERMSEQESTDGQTGIETDLIVAKNRNGPTDTVKLVFIPQFTRFEQMTKASQ